jgi:hypothetical protein
MIMFPFMVFPFLNHRRDAEGAEIKFFSFVAETPTNENPLPLCGRIIALNLVMAISLPTCFYCLTTKKLDPPGGLEAYFFSPSQRKEIRKYSLRLEGAL